MRSEEKSSEIYFSCHTDSIRNNSDALYEMKIKLQTE